MSLYAVQRQKIVEINEEGEIVWSWDPFNNLSMNDFDNFQDRHGLKPTIMVFITIGSILIPFILTSLKMLFIYHRAICCIIKIDYPTGNLIWNMGLPEQYMYSGSENICNDLLLAFNITQRRPLITIYSFLIMVI